MPAKCHHSAICVSDFAASLRFYTEGLGLELLWEKEFEGDWPTLFGAPQPRLHSAFLGDPAVPDAGIVELVEFPGGMAAGTPQGPTPQLGFFLLSFYVDVDATLDRLAALGMGGEPRRIEVAGMGGQAVPMAVVRDPDGVIVELIGA
jgi:catechol 2,3-dioxygenase-like lactoylglutathione lyase family enzyme